MPRHRYNEARSFIASGLQDVSLSRSTLTWGVPVPWDESHVFYVWFDALLNYYTALSYATPGEDLTERFWPAQFHIIGKDILKFHTVFWPAMLHGRRPAAARARLRPRLPAHARRHGRGAQDEQVAGQRARPVRQIIERVRHRRPALLLHARGLLRPRRLGLGRRLRRALRVRARQRPRQPRQPRRSRWSSATATARCPTSSSTPSSPRRSTAPRREVCALLDGADLSGALEAIWQRVRRLNRYVEEQAPWTLAKDPDRAAELDRVLASLAEGLRVVAVLLHAVAAREHRQAARRARRARARARRRADAGRAPGHDLQARAAVPEAAVLAPVVIDSHTHLHVCKPDDAELVAAATDAGVTRMLTVGTDGASCREALLAAERFPQVFAAIGRHPNEATGFDDADLAELAALAGHPRCAAIGETGPGLLPRPRAASPTSSAPSRRRSSSPARPPSRSSSTRRAAEDDTIATLRDRAAGVRVVLHCFSMPDRLDECVDAGWWISFAGNVTYPKAQDLAAAAERVPEDRLLVETDAPVPHAAGRAQGAQPAGLRRPHRALRRRAPRGLLRASSRRSSSATPPALFGW